MFDRFGSKKNFKKGILQSCWRVWGKSWARNLKAVKQIKPMNEAIINFRKTKNKANVIIAYYLAQKK